MSKTVTLTVTNAQYDFFKSTLALLEERANEPPEKKTIEINFHSVAKHCGRTYCGIKRSVRKLKL